MQWAVAAAAMGSEPLDRTLHSFAVLGWDNIRLFVDPETTIASRWSELPITCLDPSLPKIAQILLIIAEQLMRHPQAEAYLFAFAPLPAHPNLPCEWQSRLLEEKSDLVVLRSQVSSALADNMLVAEAAVLLPRSAAKQFISDPHLLECSDSASITSFSFDDWASTKHLRVHYAEEKAEQVIQENESPATFTTVNRKISVIVPTWNCGRWLERCLRSLLGQTVKPEIIVVDDASTDHTASVLKSFQEKVKVVWHGTRSGANAARNTGLGAATGELIAFADADNEYAPHWLERLLEGILTAPDIGVAYCGYTKIFENGARSAMASKPWDIDELWYGNYIDMPSLVRRGALPKEGLREGFAPFDDWRLWLHLADTGWKGHWVEEFLFDKWMREQGKTRESMSAPWQRAKEIAQIRRQYAHLVGLDQPLEVVIPACNCEDLTIRCLDHLAAFAGLTIRILYVDNGSSAEAMRTVADHAEILGLQLCILRNRTNQGFTAAVNRGLSESTSPAVLVLNNDCFVGPNCVENLAWEVLKRHNVAAAGPLTGDDGRQSLRYQQRIAQARLNQTVLKHLDDPVHCANRLRHTRHSVPEEVLSFFCAMLNRQAIEKIGMLDARFGSGLAADDEWCLRARQAGWSVVCSMNAYAAHLHKSSFQRLGIDRDALIKQAKADLQELLQQRS